jgi:hypothetical protein
MTLIFSKGNGDGYIFSLIAKRQTTGSSRPYPERTPYRQCRIMSTYVAVAAMQRIDGSLTPLLLVIEHPVGEFLLPDLIPIHVLVG